jgi:hypothetical protein
VPIVIKSGSLILLEPSGPLQPCNGIALPIDDEENNNNKYKQFQILLIMIVNNLLAILADK